MNNCGALVLLFSFLLMADIPHFGPSTLIEANGNPIEVDVGLASPCVTDWNGDGKKDLILGQFGGGKIRYYENIGTNLEPAFGNFEFLKADGQEISLEAS